MGASCFGCNTIETNNFDIIEIHNIYRKRHNANELKLSSELCNKAKNKILQLSRNEYNIDSVEEDDDDNEIGENLYICQENKNLLDICRDWYNEKEKYDFNLNKYQKGTGHFTQMVWKATKEIGFSYSFINEKKYFLVCYYPIGNELSKFKENVQKEKK